MVPPAGWERRGQTLVREFRFRDFDDGMRLMDRIAADAVDHGRRQVMSSEVTVDEQAYFMHAYRLSFRRS
jgi:pterin-4a-carbinolamine dehydratase